MSDLIERDRVLNLLKKHKSGLQGMKGPLSIVEYYTEKLIEKINEMPSAEPEIKPISYRDCSNAMLMMWMDNVITDGEYNRIMDKLNAKHIAERKYDE